MASGVILRKTRRAGPLISLVPMIDVMLILLVFFMVTSTYLNLDMIPAVQQQSSASETPALPGRAGTVLVRLAADGVPVAQGQRHSQSSLGAMFEALISDAPLTQVLILPTGATRTQALISVMDTATSAGVTRLRVIRLEARH